MITVSIIIVIILYKLNVFHWHLTDDEGWRLEVPALPNLTDRGAWRGRGEAVEPQYAGGPGRYSGPRKHVGRNHVGRFTRTGCTGTLVQVHGLHH